jgi:protein-S-isoprenylcysteine O-methyltransferase Ste14
MTIRIGETATARIVAWGGALLFALSLGWFFYCYLIPFGILAPAGSRAKPIATDILLFSVFALHHSLLARTRLKQRIREIIPPELERSLYTWTASTIFILVCALWEPVPGVLYRLDGIGTLVGYAVQGAGVVLTLRAGANMDFLELAGVRQVQHAARPADPQHIELQTRGLYGFVRHPLYFAWVLLVFGSPTMTATRATFAIISTAYLVIAIPFEEQSLIESFGPAYDDYRSRVRWRMIPGIY